MATAAETSPKSPIDNSQLATASEFLPEDSHSLYLLEMVEDIRGALEGINEIMRLLVKNAPELEYLNLSIAASAWQRHLSRKLDEIEKRAYLGEK